jgi:hypothetical protein
VRVNVSGILLCADRNTIAAHKNPRKQAVQGDVHRSPLHMTSFTPGGGACRGGHPLRCSSSEPKDETIPEILTEL